MNSNHIALHLVTKGIFDTLALTTKGFLINIGIIRRHGGSQKEHPGYEKQPEYFQQVQYVPPTPEVQQVQQIPQQPPLYYPREELFREIKENPNDIELIKVYVDWDKLPNVSKKIEGRLIKKRIQTEILNEFNKIIPVQIKRKKPD